MQKQTIVENIPSIHKVNLKEWKVINQKTLIIILGALCAVFIITTAGLAVYYTSVVSDKDQLISNLYTEVARLSTEVHDLNTTTTALNNTITQKNNLITQKNDEIISLNNQITSLNSQIAELEEGPSQPTGQAMLIVDDFNAEDLRFGSSYALHIDCHVKNTGGGVAYNALLQIRAYNAEGVAIDTYHPFGGITAGRSVGLDFSVEYTGSPIQSWDITPIWTNQFVIPVSGIFPP